MGILHNFFKNTGEKDLQQFQKIVDEINKSESDLVDLSDSELREKTDTFRKRLSSGETEKDLLPEAFAVVREAAKRTLGQRHYDVQLIGGLVLHGGSIAEMKTGEGKTLVATLSAYLNTLSGNGVHIVTVNDYLARRDAVWMGEVYSFLGLSVSVINHESSYIYDETVQDNEKDKERDTHGSFHVVYDFLRGCTRKEAYEADITYGTNSEFGFDYLRDNLAYDKDTVVQKGHNYAIVDEIDSILIDEARTPLIISAPIGSSESLYPQFASIAQTMRAEEDYTLDEKLKAIQLTDSGITKAERALNIENIYTDRGIKYVHHLETAVRAKALFEKDKDYVVRDGEVVIVDQSTGRMQPGRRWSEGLHQAIEAKENVEIKEESRTFASISYQNYFRMYEKLSGMTGTAATSAEEFSKVYNLETIAIPTNKPIARIDNGDLIFQTEKGKFTAIAKKVKELYEKGQPVLVGTASIDKNELLSQFFKKEGIPHEILNAKNHESEGEIISSAGRRGSVVIATNMAGRGVDIKIGGVDATNDAYNEVKDLGGLFVLGTERHEARRIDNQLRGRSGRQGDPGETQFFVSLEDTLMRVFASDRVKSMMGRFGIPEDEPIKNNFISKAIESAQGKIEGFNFDARKHLLDFDNVLNHQRASIYSRRKKILMGNIEDLKTEYTDMISEHSEKEIHEKTIKEKEEKFGVDRFWNTFGQVSLQAIDMFWVEHLEAMDYLRGTVNLRAYGQRDPLIEYRKEGLRMFRELEFAISEQILRIMPKVGEQGIAAKEESDMREVHESASALSDNKRKVASINPIDTHKKQDKVGRNDPCPCGSGKKYKKCGLLETEEHKKLIIGT